MKSFLFAFAGSFIGTIVAGLLVFFMISGYIEGKLAIIGTATAAVESVITEAPGAIDKITNSDIVKRFTNGN